jgi:hypothetical protein
LFQLVISPPQSSLFLSTTPVLVPLPHSLYFPPLLSPLPLNKPQKTTPIAPPNTQSATSHNKITSLIFRHCEGTREQTFPSSLRAFSRSRGAKRHGVRGLIKDLTRPTIHASFSPPMDYPPRSMRRRRERCKIKTLRARKSRTRGLDRRCPLPGQPTKAQHAAHCSVCSLALLFDRRARQERHGGRDACHDSARSSSVPKRSKGRHAFLHRGISLRI